MSLRLLVAAVLIGLFAAPAQAQEPESLPEGTWMVPRDGAARPASSWPDATPFEMIEFTIYLDHYEEEVHAFDVEVSTSPGLDPDGTLADAARIDAYVAAPRPASPEIFSARTNLDSQWLSVPGSYFWQARYYEHDELYVSPVRRLLITPRAAPDPPTAPVPLVTPAPAAIVPPPLTTPAPPASVPARLAPSAMRTLVRRAIARATRRSPRGLLSRCVSVPGGRATCRPSWHDVRASYRGTLRIRSGAAGIQASFSGTTTARSCVRRCKRAIEWSTSL